MANCSAYSAHLDGQSSTAHFQYQSFNWFVLTKRCPQKAVRYLLEAGANIGMKNQFEEAAITQIPADTFEDFLNEHCMKTNNMDVNSPYLTLTFDYR